MAKYAKDLLTLPRHELWVIDTRRPWKSERSRIGVLAVKDRIVYVHFNPDAPAEHQVLGATVFLTRREAQLRRHGLLCRMASTYRSMSQLNAAYNTDHMAADQLQKFLLQLAQGPMVYVPEPAACTIIASMARRFCTPVPPWATEPAKPPAPPMRARELRLVYSRP